MNDGSRCSVYKQDLLKSTAQPVAPTRSPNTATRRASIARPAPHHEAQTGTLTPLLQPSPTMAPLRSSPIVKPARSRLTALLPAMSTALASDSNPSPGPSTTKINPLVSSFQSDLRADHDAFPPSEPTDLTQAAPKNTAADRSKQRQSTYQSPTGRPPDAPALGPTATATMTRASTLQILWYIWVNCCLDVLHLQRDARPQCASPLASTGTAPRLIPKPEICDFCALTPRHCPRSLLRRLGATLGSRPGHLARPSARTAHPSTLEPPDQHTDSPASVPIDLPALSRRYPTTTYRSCDLGCGGGGTSLGLQLAGVQVSMGIDLNNMSLKTFAKNFPGALAHGGDLHQVASIIAAIKMRGGINVIAASSPCQPHSPSTPKSSLIPDDPRAQLTLRIAEIVVGVMPKVFVLENVAGLLKSRYGYWTKAKDLLRKHGYNVSWSVIDAAKVGVPQHRRRLLVVATLDFSVDVPAASTLLADRPDTTVRDKLPWLGDYYYHYSRDNRSSCVRSTDTACPTLRTNCHHFPAKYIPRPSDRGRPFSKCRKYNKHDLAALSGWPPDAWLPDSLKDTMFILGNCVPPPMMAWLFNLVSSAASKALDTEMARLDENVARYCSIALPTADLSAFDGAAAIDLQGMAVQAIFDKYDLSRPGAYTPPIQGTLDPWLLSHDRAVPDVDSNVTGVHLAQLQRRERLRTSVLLRTKTRSDGSTRDLREPVWNAPPPDVPPSSSNPTGMFGARPYVRVPDVDSKLHSSSHVSAKHAHWAAAHVTHCQRCIEYSTAVVGTPPPIFSIQAAHVTGQTPDPKSFVLCPGCYQLGMLADIKEGFDPRIEPAPDPVKIENGGSCFDEWDQTLSYMLKLDALGCMADGVWELPKGAVVSALHVVTRPSDMRRFKRDGTPYAVRTVLDLTKSQVNAAQKRWRFRLEGADGAVRLIGETGHKYLGACDISKYFPSIGLHPRAQQFCWIKDPRASTTWGGRGKPTASWLKFQAERKASGVRIPPYRRCTGMPLGLALAPAFACSLAAEIVQILTAMGIKAVQYVDDALVSGSTIVECQCNMDTAMSVLRWLGFTCNAAKTTGPSTCLKFIGYEFDTVAGTIAIGQERKEELISLLDTAISTKKIDTRDLETLIGKLGYTASVMRGARAFIYRMRVAHRTSAKAGLKHTRLGPAPIADMTWWLKQLRGPWSGSRIFVKGADLPILKMKSDASGGGGPEAATLGWGYQLGRAIHWQRWDPSTAVVEEQHIQWKELLAISHVCTEYGHLFANSILRCSVDNSGVQYIVNKLSSSCPTLMHLLRIIADAQCRHNFDIVASHVSREFNELTDCLSRWQVPGDIIPYLPPGVSLPPWLKSLEPRGERHRCRTLSQASSGPVYRALLQLQSNCVSPPAQPQATVPRCGNSTSSAPSSASRPCSSSTRWPRSSSGTLAASSPSSATPTLRARSTSRRGATTATTSASSSPTKVQPPSGGSTSSSTRSAGSSRTSPSRTSRSPSTCSRAWPPSAASTAPPISGRLTWACSATGPAACALTRSSCAAASTSSVPAGPTSSTTATVSAAQLAPDRKSRSMKAGRACCPSSSAHNRTLTLEQSLTCSSAGSTASAASCRAQRTRRCSRPSPTASSGRAAKPARTSLPGCPPPSPPLASQARLASPASAREAQPTPSLRAPRTKTSEQGAIGARTRSADTTARPLSCSASASTRFCRPAAHRARCFRSSSAHLELSSSPAIRGGDDCQTRNFNSRDVRGGRLACLSRPKPLFANPVWRGGGEWHTHRTRRAAPVCPNANTKHKHKHKHIHGSERARTLDGSDPVTASTSSPSNPIGTDSTSDELGILQQKAKASKMPGHLERARSSPSRLDLPPTTPPVSNSPSSGR